METERGRFSWLIGSLDVRLFALVLMLAAGQAGAGVGYYTAHSSGVEEACDAAQYTGGFAWAECALGQDYAAGTVCPNVWSAEPQIIVMGVDYWRVSGQVKEFVDAACANDWVLVGVSADLQSPPACDAGQFDPGTGECVIPCDPGSDLGRQFSVPGFNLGDQCMTAYGSDGCIAVMESSMSTSLWSLSVYRLSAQACSAEPDNGAAKDSLPYGEVNCVTVNGRQTCFDPAQENCGYVNGNPVCMDAVENEGCYSFGDGALVCGDGVATPPGPDSGVPGTPATPDVVITDDLGETVNYYDSSTVINSSGPVSSQDADGSGTGEGTGEGTGSGSASGSCEVPPICEGDPIQCALLVQEWYSGCPAGLSEAEIIEAAGLTGVGVEDLESGGGDFSGGLDDEGFFTGTRQCNIDVTMDLGAFFGSYVIPFSEWCSVFSFAGYLVMVSAGLISARIIGGAF